MHRSLLAAAALCCVAVPALAADATWSPGPLYVFLQPYLLSAFGVLITALLTWLCTILKSKFNLDVSNAAKADLQQSALNAAGRIMASQDATVANLKVPVGSPLITAELTKVQVAAADAIQQLGITPDRVANLIQGKLGQLQAQALAGPVLVVPPLKEPAA